VAGLAVNNRLVRQEQLRTRDALDRAEQERAKAQAILDFLQNKLLAQADPWAQANALRKGNPSKGAKAEPTRRQLPDRTALQLTRDQIGGQFPAQPLVQAAILKTIGETYRGIGEYAPAASHLVRARDVQTRELGPDHPDTLATAESLARTYLDDRKL